MGNLKLIRNTNTILANSSNEMTELYKGGHSLDCLSDTIDFEIAKLTDKRGYLVGLDVFDEILRQLDPSNKYNDLLTNIYNLSKLLRIASTAVKANLHLKVYRYIGGGNAHNNDLGKILEQAAVQLGYATPTPDEQKLMIKLITFTSNRLESFRLHADIGGNISNNRHIKWSQTLFSLKRSIGNVKDLQNKIDAYENVTSSTNKDPNDVSAAIQAVLAASKIVNEDPNTYAFSTLTKAAVPVRTLTDETTKDAGQRALLGRIMPTANLYANFNLRKNLYDSFDDAGFWVTLLPPRDGADNEVSNKARADNFQAFEGVMSRLLIIPSLIQISMINYILSFKNTFWRQDFRIPAEVSASLATMKREHDFNGYANFYETVLPTKYKMKIIEGSSVTIYFEDLLKIKGYNTGRDAKVDDAIKKYIDWTKYSDVKDFSSEDGWKVRVVPPIGEITYEYDSNIFIFEQFYLASVIHSIIPTLAAAPHVTIPKEMQNVSLTMVEKYMKPVNFVDVLYLNGNLYHSKPVINGNKMNYTYGSIFMSSYAKNRISKYWGFHPFGISKLYEAATNASTLQRHTLAKETVAKENVIKNLMPFYLYKPKYDYYMEKGLINHPYPMSLVNWKLSDAPASVLYVNFETALWDKSKYPSLIDHLKAPETLASAKLFSDLLADEVLRESKKLIAQKMSDPLTRAEINGVLSSFGTIVNITENKADRTKTKVFGATAESIYNYSTKFEMTYASKNYAGIYIPLRKVDGTINTDFCFYMWAALPPMSFNINYEMTDNRFLEGYFTPDLADMNNAFIVSMSDKLVTCRPFDYSTPVSPNMFFRENAASFWNKASDLLVHTRVNLFNADTACYIPMIDGYIDQLGEDLTMERDYALITHAWKGYADDLRIELVSEKSLDLDVAANEPLTPDHAEKEALREQNLKYEQTIKELNTHKDKFDVSTGNDKQEMDAKSGNEDSANFKSGSASASGGQKKKKSGTAKALKVIAKHLINKDKDRSTAHDTKAEAKMDEKTTDDSTGLEEDSKE